MTFKPALSLLACLAVLAGCATLSEDECRTANWRDIGQRDGLDGKPASHLAQHAKACAEYGLRPDESRYHQGRNEGLREYCRLDNAFDSGLRGQSYQGVCPAAIDRDFRRYHEAAYAVYTLRRDLDAQHDRIDSLSQRLREKKLSDRERDDIRREIRDIERQMDYHRDRLRDAERRLDRARDDARYGR